MSTVAILGAGSVGRALGGRLIEIGARVRYGVRDTVAAAAGLTGDLAAASVHAPAEAVADADLVLLAVPADAAVGAAQAGGDLTRTVLVDCTNPVHWENGPVWAPPPEGSVAQALAHALPGVPVVKGFNHFGAEIQRRPSLAGGGADALFAGDHAEGKARVMEVAGAMGFVPRDAGLLRNAALLENLAVLWIQLSTAGGVGRHFAFRVEAQRLD